MALYIMLTTLTAEGRKSMMKNPGRTWEVNKEVEDMGAKVVAQYSVLGPYDFVNVLEAPNNEVMARVGAQIGARGTLKVLTMAAITMQDLVKEIQMAKAMKE
jgi:uncharacterized protein with GYD domain